MNINFFVSVVIGAGLGTAIVEIAFKLFLSHWLQKRYFEYTIKRADRRELAEQILELISSKNYKRWWDTSDDIYNQEYLISDKLITIGEKESSKVLDKYANAQRNSRMLLDKITAHPAQADEAQKHFLETQAEIDKLREELVQISKKLKEK